MLHRFTTDAIAVTGIGLVCPLGATRDEVWRGVEEGRCGISEIRHVDIRGLSFRGGGEIAELDLSRVPEWIRQGTFERATAMTVMVADEALGQANLDPRAVDGRRIAITLGSCQYRMGRVDDFLDVVDRDGAAAADPVPIIWSQVRTPADALAAHLDIRGPKVVISNACAAGASAIGAAVDLLRCGRADVVLAGGVDLLESLSMAGFDSVKAVDSRPCSPYSRSEGINLGEGAAIMVLERAPDARRRGADALAYICGYGLSSDAHHSTAPDPTGAGAVRAMRRALRQAGLSPEAVDYVNGHGTGTTANDSAEMAGMRTLFGARVTDVPISSTKSQIGHTLGAAGAIETAVTVLAVRNQVLPPTIHVPEDAERPGGLDIVPNRGRPAAIATALSSSFAFGGANCAVVVADREHPIIPVAEADRIVVTGRGLVSSAGCLDDFLQTVRDGRTTVQPIRGYPTDEYVCTLGGEVTDRSHLRRIDPSYVRRLDQIGRLTVSAARMALDDARLRIAASERDRAGLIFSTFTGPTATMGNTRSTAKRDGLDNISPVDFPNVVMNAAAGHACLSLQLKGPTTTFVTGFAAGLSAVGYAADLLRQGEADALLAAGADELTPQLHVSLDRLGMLSPSPSRPYDRSALGYVPAAAGCVLVLESLESARLRGATMHGEILGYAVTSDGYGVVGIDPSGRAWEECLRLALCDAGVEPDDVACVFGDGRGSPVVDRAELKALNAVFGESGVRLATLSGQLGHAASTQALLHSVAALDACTTGAVPDVAGIDDPLSEMRGMRWRGPIASGRSVAVVTTASPGGTYAALVVGAVQS